MIIYNDKQQDSLGLATAQDEAHSSQPYIEIPYAIDALIKKLVLQRL